MSYPTDLATRLTRAGLLVTIARYPLTGYYEITRETRDADGHYYARELYDTGRDAWAAYKRNTRERKQNA